MYQEFLCSVYSAECRRSGDRSRSPRESFVPGSARSPVQPAIIDGISVNGDSWTRKRATTARGPLGRFCTRCTTYHLNERRRNFSTRSNWPLIHEMHSDILADIYVPTFPPPPLLHLVSTRVATALLRLDAPRLDVNSFTANDIIKLLYQSIARERAPLLLLAPLLRANYPSSSF